MFRRTPRPGQRFVTIRPERIAEQYVPDEAERMSADARMTDARLSHAVEAAGSAVREATANLAEAYATLQQAEAHVRSYRSLFCGRTAPEGDPASSGTSGQDTK